MNTWAKNMWGPWHLAEAEVGPDVLTLCGETLEDPLLRWTIFDGPCSTVPNACARCYGILIRRNTVQIA